MPKFPQWLVVEPRCVGFPRPTVCVPPLAKGHCFLPLQALPPVRRPGPRPGSRCLMLWKRVSGGPRLWTSRAEPSRCSLALRPMPPLACTASAWRPPLATRAPASCWATSTCSLTPGAQVSRTPPMSGAGRWVGLDHPQGPLLGVAGGGDGAGWGMGQKRQQGRWSEAHCTAPPHKTSVMRELLLFPFTE